MILCGNVFSLFRVLGFPETTCAPVRQCTYANDQLNLLRIRSVRMNAVDAIVEPDLAVSSAESKVCCFRAASWKKVACSMPSVWPIAYYAFDAWFPPWAQQVHSLNPVDPMASHRASRIVIEEWGKTFQHPCYVPLLLHMSIDPTIHCSAFRSFRLTIKDDEWLIKLSESAVLNRTNKPVGTSEDSLFSAARWQVKSGWHMEKQYDMKNKPVCWTTQRSEKSIPPWLLSNLAVMVTCACLDQRLFMFFYWQGKPREVSLYGPWPSRNCHTEEVLLFLRYIVQSLPENQVLQGAIILLDSSLMH